MGRTSPPSTAAVLSVPRVLHASMDAFADPKAVARYAENPPRMVPGYADMQRMAMLLMAERAPVDGEILVLGAGGGLEMKVFAEAQPGWSFVGIDPSAAMLDLAKLTLGDLAARASLHEGFIESAPDGPFDAAACILTLHFIERQERLRTLGEVRKRLKPGSPFVVAHYSIPHGEIDVWMSRFAAFAASSGMQPSEAERARATVIERLPILSPDDDERLLAEAGFGGVRLFYAGFAFRGWVAYA